MRTIIEICVLFFLLVIAALTAASETSIIAVSRMKVRKLAAEGSKAAKIILKILEKPERFFGTLLVANNIVGVLIASLVTVMMIALTGDESAGVAVATVIATAAIIVFEVVAKTLAARRSEKLSLVMARPIKALIAACSPVVKILEAVTNSIVGLFIKDSKAKPSLVIDEEIKAMIKIGAEEDSLHKTKYKMLSNVFAFSEAVVKDVMTPKRDMVSIDVNAVFDDIMGKVLESGYSRIPVFKERPEDIIGSINVKDLLSLSCNRSLVVLQDIIYPPVLVPGAKKVTELLKEFQKGHTHIAFVTDESGKVEGLVTLEDLLEEIVGEIEDEYDIRGK